MGRIKSDLLEKTERVSHRMVDVAEVLASQRRSLRVVDQIIGCGTSFGANAFEADEAQSRPEFCRIVGTVLRELNESRYWLRFLQSRDWIESRRLTPLHADVEELKRIYGAMVARVRKADGITKRRPSRA